MTVSDMWERPGLSPEERARAFVDAFGGHFAAAVEMIRAAVAKADAAWAQEVNRAVDAETERCARVAENFVNHRDDYECSQCVTASAIARAIRQPSAARVPEPWRDAIWKMIEGMIAWSADEDGIHHDAIPGLDAGLAALRDGSCAECGGAGWRWVKTPDGDWDEELRRCKHGSHPSAASGGEHE